MNRITKICGWFGKNGRGYRYYFSKNQNKKHGNPNYHYKKKQQNADSGPSLKPEKQDQRMQGVRIVKFDHVAIRHYLFMANMALAGVIPFFEPVNAGILLINGGYMLGLLGHEIKQFLILMANRHYGQLKHFRKPQEYVRLILQNMLFLSASSVSLAFNCYPFAHFVTIGWLSYNIHREVVPSYLWPIAFSILFVIMLNIFGKGIKKFVQPSAIDIVNQIQEKK